MISTTQDAFHWGAVSRSLKVCVLTLCCLTFISACQTIKGPSSTVLAPLDQNPSPATMTSWTAKGKISLRFNEKTTNANLVWSNQEENYEIRLFGPIGIGAASLTKKGNEVVLKSRDGEFRSSSGQDLLYEHLGLYLPIDEMHSWIKGLAYPEKLIQQGWSENTRGEFLSLQQSGWKLEFAKRESHPQLADDYTLPGKVKVSFAGNKELGPVKIIVVIKDWEIH